MKLKLAFLFLAAAGALVATNNPSLAAKSGAASSYSTKEGLKTASSARRSGRALKAAHRKVRVTNRRNGRTIVVTINDRGPFVRGRIIDLTPAGARALGFSGLTQVTVERMG